MAAEVSIVPANEASWADLRTVVGTMRCHGALCFCQRFKIGWSDWRDMTFTDEERAHRLREQTDCGHPGNGPTSGLVAYVDGEPAGWCNVESRSSLPFIPEPRVVSKKRGEDRTDPAVWVVACFVVRTEFRWGGITRALAPAAVEFARQRGARALEAYPMLTEPGIEITWGELHVGSRNVFAQAGLAEVAHPHQTPLRHAHRLLTRCVTWPGPPRCREYPRVSGIERCRSGNAPVDDPDEGADVVTRR